MGKFFGGGPKPPATIQTKSTFKPSADQQRLLKPVVAAGEAYAASPPKMPGYSQVAAFDPTQTAAQNLVLGAVPQLQAAATGAADTNRFLTSSNLLSPDANPFLRETIDAAIRPINENFLETILPGIRGEAITAGGYGGSRDLNARALAAGRSQQAAADAASRIASQGYGQGLDTMSRNAALTPQVLAGLLAPGQAASAVGDTRQNLAQAQLDERAFRDMYAQIAPWLAAKEVAGVGAGLPGGTNINTQPNPQASMQQPSLFQKLLGIGSTIAGFIPGPHQAFMLPLSMGASALGNSGKAGLF